MITESLKESEIRPKDIFDEYLNLAKMDCDLYFANCKKVKVTCYSCDKPGRVVFEKNGFNYDLCDQCHNLYVSPRPLAEAFATYYKESASAKYWATTFYKETAARRRQKVWIPKAKIVLDILKKHHKSSDLIIDIGGGYGVFAEVMKEKVSCDIRIIEPSNSLATICRQRGFEVIEKFLEDVHPVDLPTQDKVFVSFELFEHLHDPNHFLKVLFNLMGGGDVFVFSTLSATGLDIQTLWESSQAVSPPHHLNFFNPYSMQVLLEKNGFVISDYYEGRPNLFIKAKKVNGIIKSKKNTLVKSNNLKNSLKVKNKVLSIFKNNKNRK